MLVPVKAKNFYYKVGNIQTTVPWFRPDPQYLNSWKEEFFSHNEVTQFRYFLHGSSLQNARCFDIDLMMANKYSNPKQLERVMEIALTAGFKNRQYIDLHWVSPPADRILEKSPCNHFEIACNSYLQNGYCTLKSCVDTHAIDNMVKYGRTIVRGNKIVFSHLNDKWHDASKDAIFGGTELLYKKCTVIVPRIIKKMQNNFYKNPIVEITKDTNFMEIIQWA
tara:strand:+ start:3216 stop:3881 length:666 start_codon:yes stop_codon:yes gene_type:complete